MFQPVRSMENDDDNERSDWNGDEIDYVLFCFDQVRYLLISRDKNVRHPDRKLTKSGKNFGKYTTATLGFLRAHLVGTDLPFL